MRTLLSIVVAVYQGEKTVERAVSSALAIPFEELEVIVVNDGSTDGTGTILERMSLQDSRLKVVNEENRGRSAARNLGVSLSSGKWLMFLDADDYLLPEAFPELVKRCRQQGRGLVVFSRRQSDKPEYSGCSASCGEQRLTATRYVESLFWEPKPTCIADEWRYNHGSTWARLYDRDMLLGLAESTGGLLTPFPEGVRFSEDRLLNIALLRTMGETEVEFVADELYYWDVGESQTCQVVHDDDADSLARYAEFVAGMERCAVVTANEADAVVGREAFYQFQRLARRGRELGWRLPAAYRDILIRKDIAGAVRRTPYGALSSSPFWRAAWRLVGRGRPGAAFRLYAAAWAVKGAVKG